MYCILYCILCTLCNVHHSRFNKLIHFQAVFFIRSIVFSHPEQIEVYRDFGLSQLVFMIALYSFVKLIFYVHGIQNKLQIPETEITLPLYTIANNISLDISLLHTVATSTRITHALIAAI